MGAGMNALPLRLAIALAQRWTRTYTWGLPTGHADRRRAEIESDLREFQRDADRGRVRAPAAQVIGRLVLGAADDVSWRLEQISIDDASVRRVVVSVAAAVSVIVMLWVWPGVLAPQSGLGGRARVADCAASVTPAESTRELRLQVLNCAGAFFLPRSSVLKGTGVDVN
jgi:hypothetical protein